MKKYKTHRHYFKVCYKCSGSRHYEGYNGYDHPCDCHGSRYCKCGASKDVDGKIVGGK
jgi:hypothetical protein